MTDENYSSDKNINDLALEINLNKKSEMDISGLTESDLRALLHIMGHIKRMEPAYVKLIPSMDINLTSGLSGRLIWKPKIGYVFALDLVSSLKM